MTPEQQTIRIGTRGSALALEQTRIFIAALRNAFPKVQIETVIMNTAGDVDKQTPLAVLGGQGVFAKELEAALLHQHIDVAVHSAKDLPSELPVGLMLGAILDRADPRDVFLNMNGQSLEDLQPGARVGTSSRRRVMQLRQMRPDLRAVELRGNVDTRLRKLAAGDVDGAIVASAGLLRMGWQERITQYLPVSTFVPSPGQGALGIECRVDDSQTRALLGQVADNVVTTEVEAERRFLRLVGGGCQSPIGAYATTEGNVLRMHAMLADEAMTVACFQTTSGSLNAANTVAAHLAKSLQHELALRLGKQAS
ncbi:MAG TPA: hydroxymethylbilane synthase [Nitrolancea sp.]|nr:hydroxymethylbilane synthase [Nitrolancea sp.]